jgi:hypothetical protein
MSAIPPSSIASILQAGAATHKATADKARESAQARATTGSAGRDELTLIEQMEASSEINDSEGHGAAGGKGRSHSDTEGQTFATSASQTDDGAGGLDVIG